jgi:hypothetical protein
MSSFLCSKWGLQLLKMRQDSGWEFRSSTDCHVVTAEPISVSQALISRAFSLSSALRCQVALLRHVVLDLGQWNILLARDLTTRRYTMWQTVIRMINCTVAFATLLALWWLTNVDGSVAISQSYSSVSLSHSLSCLIATLSQDWV